MLPRFRRPAQGRPLTGRGSSKILESKAWSLDFEVRLRGTTTHDELPRSLEAVMIRTFAALALVGSAALGSATLATVPATAATSYDGTWSVLIITNSGPCDRAYRYAVSIRNGVVNYTGGAD